MFGLSLSLLSHQAVASQTNHFEADPSPDGFSGKRKRTQNPALKNQPEGTQPGKKQRKANNIADGSFFDLLESLKQLDGANLSNQISTFTYK
jgi:hypothetical protein